MTAISVGDTLYVPVEVSGGAFLGECLISIDTLDGPVSGFINQAQIKGRDEAKFVEAKVLDVREDRIAVRLHGSFFTTTGLAHISHEARFERAA